MADNYYKILGVRLNADLNAIKKAYRTRAKQFHPDTNPGDKKAEQKFKEVNEAYETLGDKQKRVHYDEFLKNAKKASARADRYPPFFFHKWASYKKDPSPTRPADTLFYGVMVCILLYGIFGNDTTRTRAQGPAGGSGLFSLNAMQAAKGAGKDSHASRNQDIGRATGLLITRTDSQGNQLPITGGYIPDSRFEIRLNNKTIIRDKNDISMNFTFHHRVNDEHVVLLEAASAEAACPTRQMIVAIKDGVAVFIKAFGNCDEPQISIPSKDGIQFSFFSTYGERRIFLYKDHGLTESTLVLPPHSDPDSGGNGYRYLMKYFDNLENIVTDTKLLPELSAMLGDNLPLLKNRLELYKRPHVEDGCIIVTGLQSTGGGANEGFLAIALDGSGVYSAILKSDYSQQTGETSRSVNIYSNRPSMYSNMPDGLSKWVENWKNTYPDIAVEWHFASEPQQAIPPT